MNDEVYQNLNQLIIILIFWLNNKMFLRTWCWVSTDLTRREDRKKVQGLYF